MSGIQIVVVITYRLLEAFFYLTTPPVDPFLVPRAVSSRSLDDWKLLISPVDIFRKEVGMEITFGH